jgi:uncharacterized membrane protein
MGFRTIVHDFLRIGFFAWVVVWLQPHDYVEQILQEEERTFELDSCWQSWRSIATV